MRVITGSARGVRLQAPKGMDTRPTLDQVKEGIFSAIQFEVEGRRVLDLFAGSGQMGIEALSRGAKSAVFVDMRQDACAVVRSNLEKTRRSCAQIT
jgi:16S rRNA (guanine966-N2)-methyltransferase